MEEDGTVDREVVVEAIEVVAATEDKSGHCGRDGHTAECCQDVVGQQTQCVLMQLL